MRFGRHFVAAVAVLALGFCTCRSRSAPSQAANAPSADAGACDAAASFRQIEEFRAKHRADYHSALARGRLWLDGLSLDPLDLRARGIKGKKKLVELLDAYYGLWLVAEGEEKELTVERVRQVAQITYEDRYHDMLTISDRWFKQDATSYLRAAVLLEKMGLDTKRYREEIRKVHPRLNNHMTQRGPYQRRIFHSYYAQFGLEEPFPLSDALKDGLIAARADPAKMSSSDVYGLTHEVYAVFEYGDRLDVDPFTREEKVYLRGALDFLARRYLRSGNADILAELICCMRYLRFTDLATYRDGLVFLLRSQNKDGSWGNYERYRKQLGDYVRHGYLLHTTLVAIDALSVAFHPHWNDGVQPACIDSASPSGAAETTTPEADAPEPDDL